MDEIASPVRVLGGAQALRLDVRRTGGATVCVLSGVLDASAPASVREAFRRLANERCLVIDASALGFVDAAGLRLLLQLVSGCRRLGGTASVAAPSQALLRLLRMVCVDRFLEVHPSLAEALPSSAPRSVAPSDSTARGRRTVIHLQPGIDRNPGRKDDNPSEGGRRELRA